MSGLIHDDGESQTSSIHFLESLSSFHGSILVVAIVSLILVTLFVFLLHAYAKWLWSESRQTRRISRATSVVVTTFNTFSLLHHGRGDESSPKGLDPSAISEIPSFVYHPSELLGSSRAGSMLAKCVICQSKFEGGEVCRRLERSCGHGFHAECIDMWLHSRSTCPLCRAPVMADGSCYSRPEAEEEEDDDDDDDDGAGFGLKDLFGGDRDEERVLEIAVDVAGRRSDVVNGGIDSASSSSSSLGCSLKRMLSRDRSESKVFPSCSRNEINV